MSSVDDGHRGENTEPGVKSAWRGKSGLHLDDSLLDGVKGEDIVNRERYSYLGHVQIDFASTDLAAVCRADKVFDWHRTAGSEKKGPHFVKDRWRTKQISRVSPAALKYGARESCANLLDLLCKEVAPSNQPCDSQSSSHGNSCVSEISNSATRSPGTEAYLLRNNYYERTFLDDMDNLEAAQPDAGSSEQPTPWGVPDSAGKMERRRKSYHFGEEAGAAADASGTWGIPDAAQVDRSRRKSTPSAVRRSLTSLWGRPNW